MTCCTLMACICLPRVPTGFFRPGLHWPQSKRLKKTVNKLEQKDFTSTLPAPPAWGRLWINAIDLFQMHIDQLRFPSLSLANQNTILLTPRPFWLQSRWPKTSTSGPATAYELFRDASNPQTGITYLPPPATSVSKWSLHTSPFVWITSFPPKKIFPNNKHMWDTREPPLSLAGD